MPEATLENKETKPVEAQYICEHCNKSFPTHEEYVKHQKSLVDMHLVVNDYINAPPEGKEALYARACSGDAKTINSWFDIWLNNTKENCKNFDVEKNSVMNVHGCAGFKPMVIAGAGPSLKKNAEQLKDRGDIQVASALHNYGYFTDLGIKPEFYLNLDAGDITIPEMCEGGSRKLPDGKIDEEWYWDQTKDSTLVTCLVGHPKLIKKWKGRVLFFNTMIPDDRYVAELKKITDLRIVYSVGGNTLGACLYHAKAVCGANPIIFVGADFCFSYDKKFHSWDSQYDQKFTGLMPYNDIFGNRVFTWPSYYNFKCWFDFIACGGQGNNPGMYINCTQGGILGAYPEGNIRQITQATLAEVLQGYKMHRQLPDLVKDKEKYTYLF